MGSDTYKLDAHKLGDFLKGLCRDRQVFALEQTGDQYHLVRVNEWQTGKHTLGAYRPVEPLKLLVFPPRENLGALRDHAPDPVIQERIVIGVKNCDLDALKIHDFVFLKTEPADPRYAELRAKTILVTCDCTDAREVCFCPAVGQQPYPKSGYDINLATTPRGMVVEAGSERGQKLLADVKDLLEPADDALVQERDLVREAVNKKVCEQTARKGLQCNANLQQAIQKSSESKLWEELAVDCVECGACNLVCCTCHCFLLGDGLRHNDKKPARIKLWDSCLYRNFARVAGGANPRKHRAERLLNRFDKKFNFFPTVLGAYACDGCGRCIEACTGKIDIREVLKRAVNELP
jgi:ferredoxin